MDSNNVIGTAFKDLIPKIFSIPTAHANSWLHTPRNFQDLEEITNMWNQQTNMQ